jgi:YD repeat-containing protein
MASFSPFDASLWYATAVPAPLTAPLEERVRMEVGFGGSGRNAGHSTPTFTHYSLAELRRMLGEPWAERLIARQTRANERVADMIGRYQIQCEWQQNGYVMGAPHTRALKTLEEKARSYNAAGARTRLIDKAEAEAITGSPRFHGGWLHEEGGHLNPLGYACGLARAVLQEGGTIHTGSAAVSCEREGSGWAVGTQRGMVVADKVIFATGAYTVGGWPKLDRTYKIHKVFVAATQPLDPAVRATVLPRNTTIHDGRGDIYVYKYNAEGRIVASMFPMRQRGRDLDYTRRVMTDRLKWLHPQITGEIRWDYVWIGELDMQYRTIPRLYGLAPGVVALTGLSGRGVPTGSMLGGILSEWALNVPEADLDLKVEPLSAAPFYMNFGPPLTLRYYRVSDWIRTKLAGADLPPHA